ncbi:hypothetical protein Scep_028765 [Stephania cephalantha]|uniref:Uncharacterized protein n=1 Tax=Stephania cephalantha TaxID=152367 RepID=A0AAP0HIF1_9MAGN
MSSCSPIIFFLFVSYIKVSLQFSDFIHISGVPLMQKLNLPTELFNPPFRTQIGIRSSPLQKMILNFNKFIGER